MNKLVPRKEKNNGHNGTGLRACVASIISPPYVLLLLPYYITIDVVTIKFVSVVSVLSQALEPSLVDLVKHVFVAVGQRRALGQLGQLFAVFPLHVHDAVKVFPLLASGQMFPDFRLQILDHVLLGRQGNVAPKMVGK